LSSTLRRTSFNVLEIAVFTTRAITISSCVYLNKLLFTFYNNRLPLLDLHTMYIASHIVTGEIFSYTHISHFHSSSSLI